MIVTQHHHDLYEPNTTQQNFNLTSSTTTIHGILHNSTHATLLPFQTSTFLCLLHWTDMLRLHCLSSWLYCSFDFVALLLFLLCTA